MASSTSLLILAFAFFISPAISQLCSRETILSTDRTPFSSCMDLPTLDSYLHYTYNASNSSLSVAYTARTSSPNGWVAWAINPTMTGMNGSQAFLAYLSGPGRAPVVATYDIRGYVLNEGRLAFDFWDLRAELMSGGRIAIFTSVKVPSGAESVNQVWQRGGNVTNGRPGVHPFNLENLNSRGVLSLTADATAPTPDGSNTPRGPRQAGGPRNAGSITSNVNVWVNLGVIVLLGSSIFIF